jgi:hypothetical protein
MNELTISADRINIFYNSGGRYSFGKIKFGTSDEGAFEVMKAIVSLQDDTPRRVVRTVTKQII